MSLGRALDCMADHYTAACAALALFILAWIGVGELLVVSVLGLLLCAAGLSQQSAQVDWRFFLPVLVYELLSAASTFAVYGNIVDGYAIFHLVFPTLYLLIACLEGKELRLLKQLCALWVAVAALLGVVGFLYGAVSHGYAYRLSGVMGNPNAMGIFLVVGWFLLLHCLGEGPAVLIHLEPVIFMALALTLSMGSFLSMAVGILVLTLGERKHKPVLFACRLLARAALGVGTGVLIYLGAARTAMPWICLPVGVYAVLVVLCWREFVRFLEEIPWAAAGISAAGMVVAAVLILLRPSSAATFAERLEMMGSGLRYLTASPLLGVGPFQWKLLDLRDGGKYFNTWHIHNVPLHIGVELGWAAMLMVLAAVFRGFRKQKDLPQKAGLTAFCVHNLIDTSFFYLGISALALTAAVEPQEKGRVVKAKVLKALFGLFGAVFAWGLYCAVRAGLGGTV